MANDTRSTLSASKKYFDLFLPERELGGDVSPEGEIGTRVILWMDQDGYWWCNVGGLTNPADLLRAF